MNRIPFFDLILLAVVFCITMLYVDWAWGEPPTKLGWKFEVPAGAGMEDFGFQYRINVDDNCTPATCPWLEVNAVYYDVQSDTFWGLAEFPSLSPISIRAYNVADPVNAVSPASNIETYPGCVSSDLTNDGIVGIPDFAVLKTNFGKVCY